MQLKSSRGSRHNFRIYLFIYLFIVYFLRFILHAKKTAFVVEHDFIMATYLADRVIVFDGTPSMKTTANRYGL